MTIKQLGGIFGRNPTFEDVTIEGQLTFDGDVDISSDLTISGDLNVTGTTSLTKDGATPLVIDRLTDNGTMLQFELNGSAVGYIGSATARFFIHNNYGAGSGFRFDNGNINPCSSTGATEDDTTDLGAAGGRFTDIYATNGTIQTSDRNEKQDIEALSDAERRVAVAAKGLLRKFRWISAVEEKGDEARIHFGIIAQDLQDAFTAEGLDAGRYGMFIHTTWTDEETGEERSRMGVRYSELLAFIISAI